MLDFKTIIFNVIIISIGRSNNNVNKMAKKCYSAFRGSL